MQGKFFIGAPALAVLALILCGCGRITAASPEIEEESYQSEKAAIETVTAAETEDAIIVDISMLPKIPLDESSVPYLKSDFFKDGDYSDVKIQPRYFLQDGDTVFCFYEHDLMSLEARRYDIYRYTISDGDFVLLCTLNGEDSRLGAPVLTDNYICWCRDFTVEMKFSAKLECVPRDGGEVRILADTSSDDENVPSYFTQISAEGDTLFWQDLKGTEYSLDVKQ